MHADFSPKNLLVFPGGLMMVDFETGHYGDPAFDLGFFLSHLVLKACYHVPRHAAYLELSRSLSRSRTTQRWRPESPTDELADLWAARHAELRRLRLGAAGRQKPVEYLSDEGRRERMRALCREVFDARPGRLAASRRRCAAATFDDDARRQR